MTRISPLEVYKLLPGINCKKCGADTCMAFASQLIERKKKVEDCTVLFEEDKYKEKREKLIELLTPPIKEVVIGDGLKVGGEEVLYRHELTFFNPTALFIDISDDMSDEEIEERVRRINKFKIERVGQELKLDGIAIRCKTNDEVRFGEVVLKVVENSKMPIALCSFNPEIIEVGLGIAIDRRPLIYAATSDNWKKFAELAKNYNCPLVVYEEDIEKMSDLVQDIEEYGVSDIILDFGTYPQGEPLARAIENMISARRAAIEDGFKPLGKPILGNATVAWLVESDPIKASHLESSLAASLMLNYADIIFMHTLETWAILPLLTLRQNIYTDPRVPIQVEPGLYAIGKPNESSPVLVTTNFALTYYTVASDVEAGKVDAYILVLDTEGLAVEPALAGAKFTASLVKEHLEKFKVDEKVNHKTIIIPGMAARLSGEIEDITGWRVLVGPIDSSRIPKFIEEKWKKNGKA